MASELELRGLHPPADIPQLVPRGDDYTLVNPVFNNHSLCPVPLETIPTMFFTAHPRYSRRRMSH